MNLCLVSVNGSAVPDAAYIQQQLNIIYAPAITTWTVSALPGGLTVSLSNTDQQIIDNSDSTDNMSYTEEEKLVNKAMKNQASYNSDNYYLFFFKSGKDASLNGYMPFKGHFGYIFKNSQGVDELMRTIAHEAAHGPFRLRHTFSDKNKYTQTQGSTTNLMDYVGSSNALIARDLYKYQWDYVHKPETMLFTLWEGKSEAEAKAVKEYYITIDGKKALKLDISQIKSEFNKILSLSAEEKASYVLNTIKVYVLGTEKNDYTISSMFVKNSVDNGNISEIVWDINKAKDAKISFYSESVGSENATIFYYADDGTIFSVFNIEIVRVYPNIAFKQNGNPDYMIKTDADKSEMKLTGSTVSLRPVFFTYSEKNSGVDDLTSLFERNAACAYLVDSIKFNETQYDVSGTMAWIEYTLGADESTYEVVTGEVSKKGIITKLNTSPFVTIRRHKGNESTGYYIEDYYLTSDDGTPPYTSIRNENNTMNTADFDVNGEPYKIPIVHYRNSGDVKLLLSDVGTSTDPIQYTIGDKVVLLGKEFSYAAQPHGTILDIKDVEGNIKGKLEFRQITETELTPTLNFVTINTEASDMDYSTVITDINAIYNTINVSWQQGKHIALDVKELYSLKKEDRDLKAIFVALKAHPDYKPNQYYMIISPDLDDFGGFSDPSLEDNWFIIQKTYKSEIPPHELGHCSGLDEYIVNIGLLSSSNRNDASSYLNTKMYTQYKSTNVMGYSKGISGYSNPLKDFYSWQISLIRQKISERINSAQ